MLVSGRKGIRWIWGVIGYSPVLGDMLSSGGGLHDVLHATCAHFVA